MAKYDWKLFLTEPTEDLPSRRRDPFGFAEIANYYADLLAPGITNRNLDARWLTILCWSLEQVGKDFRNNSTDGYYNYLRGLELRWIIEACRLADEGKGRHLPGSRAVRRWLKNGQIRSLEDEMGKDQWQRYKYVGPYASYRRLLQETGLLDVDGWTPIGNGFKLAKLLKPFLKENTNKTTDGSWVDYWLRRWPEKERPQSELIAKPSDSLRLTKQEINLIEPLIFDDSENGKRRRIIVKAITTTKADNHAEMCRQIQRNLMKTSSWHEEERGKFQKLGAFAELADTAVETLKAAFKSVVEPTAVSNVAKNAATEIDALNKVIKNWPQDGVWPKVDSFAMEISKTENQGECLTSLVRLHIIRGSGLKWLTLKNDNLDRAIRYSTPPYGFYRFRLEALARLAVGCGVIDNLPSVLSAEADEEDE